MISAKSVSLSFLCGMAVCVAAGAWAADASMDGMAMPAAHRSVQHYVVPTVDLVRADGRKVALRHEIDDGRPVVMNFVFTSCTTICPMASQLFERFQQALGTRAGSVHLVSISIDPEQDTPARLRAYAKQYHAARGWDYYTGSTEAVETVERAFNAFNGDKMSHRPLTLMRAAPGRPWVRLDGFATPATLIAESRRWSIGPGLARAVR